MKKLVSSLILSVMASQAVAAPIAMATASAPYKIARQSDVLTVDQAGASAIQSQDEIRAGESLVRLNKSGETFVAGSKSVVAFTGENVITLTQGELVASLNPKSTTEVHFADLAVRPAAPSEKATTVALASQDAKTVQVANYGETPVAVVDRDTNEQLALLGRNDRMTFTQSEKGTWMGSADSNLPVALQQQQQTDPTQGGDVVNNAQTEEEDDRRDEAAALWWIPLVAAGAIGGGYLVVSEGGDKGFDEIADDVFGSDDDDDDDRDDSSPILENAPGGGGNGGGHGHHPHHPHHPPHHPHGHHND